MQSRFLIPIALVSCLSPGLAAALTNADSVTALSALPGVNTDWIVANNWRSLDATQAAHAGVWDSPIGVNSDPCGERWVGIYCNGGDITHIEVPNAKMTGTLAEVFTALAPIKAQLISLNFSSTTATDKNTLSGGIPADGSEQGYTQLRYLAFNGVGASGDIPDLSSYTALGLANFYDNDFSSYTGPVGGAALHTLGLKNNPSLAGDLAATLLNSPNLRRVSSDNSQLTGGLNPAENVIVSRESAAGSVSVNWAQPSAGLVPDSYAVAISGDGGATWSDLEVAAGADNVAYASGLAAGSYVARVTSQMASGLASTVAAFSGELAIAGGDNAGAVGTGTVTTAGSVATTDTNTDTVSVTDTSSGSSSSGGGAALWLSMLALSLVFRRR